MTADRHSARTAAQRMRAAVLIDVAEGRRGLKDVIELSTFGEHRPLLRLSLRQLLIAQPGWGPARADRVIQQMLAVLDLEGTDIRKITMQWLLDSRAGGRRFMALCDALMPKTAPWPGFPFAPRPAA